MNRPRRKPDPEAVSSPPEVRRAAMNLLARREHSRGELNRKLIGKGFEPAVVEDVLCGLARDGLLSDDRFVEEYARSRVARGFGPERIAAELGERGVARELVDSVLRSYAAQWSAHMVAVRRKRFGTEIPADWQARARQMRFLQQRGFSAELIRRVFADEDAT